MSSLHKTFGSALDFAGGELGKIGLIERKDVIDGTLVRVPDAYPAYFYVNAEDSYHEEAIATDEVRHASARS